MWRAISRTVQFALSAVKMCANTLQNATAHSLRIQNTKLYWAYLIARHVIYPFYTKPFSLAAYDLSKNFLLQGGVLLLERQFQFSGQFSVVHNAYRLYENSYAMFDYVFRLLFVMSLMGLKLEKKMPLWFQTVACILVSEVPYAQHAYENYRLTQKLSANLKINQGEIVPFIENQFKNLGNSDLNDAEVVLIGEMHTNRTHFKLQALIIARLSFVYDQVLLEGAETSRLFSVNQGRTQIESNMWGKRIVSLSPWLFMTGWDNKNEVARAYDAMLTRQFNPGSTPFSPEAVSMAFRLFDDPDLYHKVVVEERNAGMCESIINMRGILPSSRIFVQAGSGHLSSDDTGTAEEPVIKACLQDIPHATLVPH